MSQRPLGNSLATAQLQFPLGGFMRAPLRAAAIVSAVAGAAVMIAVTQPADAAPSVTGATHRSVKACSTAAAGEASCHALVRTDLAPLAKAGPNTTPSGYGPTQLRSAYNLISSGSSSQTIAIVDAYNDPTAEADLGVYRTQFGLSACTTANGCFRKVNQTG